MKIRQLLFWILVPLVALSACVSASRSLEKGNYDDAIEKTIRVLLKEPSNAKNLKILNSAYELANTADLERIESLKASGRPDIWDNIVTTYEKLKKRNDRIKTLPSSVQNEINFTYNSYSEDIIAGKQKAAEYNYLMGQQKLESGTRADARAAYDYFQKAISYFGRDYRDVGALQNEALERGLTYVLYKVENRSGLYISPEARADLSRVYPEQLNSKWIIYHLEPIRNYYDYEVTFILRTNNASPVFASTSKRTYEKTIQDGTEYKTDSKGKPVLDTAGNFIKVPRNIKVRCDVIENTHYKSYIIGGDVVYYESATQRWLKTASFSIETKVNSTTYHVNGDTRALDNRLRDKIGMRPAPLPNDAEMMVMACIDASFKIRDIMFQNRNLIK